MKETSDAGATIWIQTLESSSIGLSNWVCWEHRRMKVKDDISLDPGSLWTSESAQFSACDNFSWETWERQAGRQAWRQGRQGLGKTDTPSNKGNKKEDKLGDNLGDKLEDKLEDKLGDKGDKTLGRRAHHPTKGNKKEDKLAHKPGDKRDKDPGRQTNYPTKGNKKGDNGRQGGRLPVLDGVSAFPRSCLALSRIVSPHVLVLDDVSAFPRSCLRLPLSPNMCVPVLDGVSAFPRSCLPLSPLVSPIGETRPREGGHTIQHQGGNLQKALGTPNSTAWGKTHIT